MMKQKATSSVASKVKSRRGKKEEEEQTTA